MRRAGRRAFSGAAAVSLGLLVGTAVLWVREWANRPEPVFLYSRQEPDPVVVVTASEPFGLSCQLTSGEGLTVVGRDVALPGFRFMYAPGLAGFGVLVGVRFWLLMTISAVLPAVWLVRWRRSRARREGRGFPVGGGG